MRVIWKYKIPGPDAEFDAPAGAIGISVEIQQLLGGQQPVLYLLANRQGGPAKHQVQLFATGANIPEDAGEYVGTITLRNEGGQPYVAHVFHRQLGVITTS